MGSTVQLLAEVLRSVDAHHPIIAAGQANVAESRARLLEARGGFDPVVRADGEWSALGYYDYRRARAVIEQPVTRSPKRGDRIGTTDAQPKPFLGRLARRIGGALLMGEPLNLSKEAPR